MHFVDSIVDFELAENSLNANVLAEHAAFAVESIAPVEVEVFVDAYVAVAVKFVSVAVFAVVSDGPFVAAHSIVCIAVVDANVAVAVFVEVLEETVIEFVQSEG